MIAHARKTRPKRRRPARRGEKSLGFAARMGSWLGSTIDNAVTVLAPEAGARRKAARMMFEFASERAEAYHQRQLHRLSQYEAAEGDRTRSRRWMGSRLSPDDGLESDLESQREHSIELYQNDCHAHAAIERRVDQEIGRGFHPQPRVRSERGVSEKLADKINQELRDRWERWAPRADVSGTEAWVDVLETIDRAWAHSGDVFVHLTDLGDAEKPVPLAIEVIDGARVETPPEFSGDPLVRLGVRKNRRGVVMGYYVRTTHPNDSRGEFKYEYLERLDPKSGTPKTLHLFDRMFPQQSRGLPWMVASINKFKDIKDTNEAELLAIEIESCFVAFIKGGKEGASPHDLAAGATNGYDSGGNRLHDVQPGAIEYIGEQEVQFGQPNRPGNSFAPFMERQLRSAAAALGMPYELIANDFFRTTFSSARASLLMGHKAACRRAGKIARKIAMPVWERFVYENIVVDGLDHLIDPSAYLNQRWVYERCVIPGPRWEFIDPTKEVAAAVEAIEADIETEADVLGARGLDPQEHREQRRREKMADVKERVDLLEYEQKLRKKAKLPEMVPATDGKEGKGGSDDSQMNHGLREVADQLEEALA